MPGKPKKMKKTSMWEQHDLEDLLTIARDKHPCAGPILERIIAKVQEHNGAEAWLETVAPAEDQERFMAYYKKMHETYPPMPEIQYLNTVPTHATHSHAMLWMLSIAEKDGYSVFAYDNFIMMVALILFHSWQSNVLDRPGIEPLQLKVKKLADMRNPRHLKFEEGGNERVINDAIQIHRLAFVKGRKRSFAVLCICAAVHELQWDIKESWPELWMSMRDTHIVVTTYDDPAQEFAAAAKCNNESALLRQRKSVFDWVFTLKEKLGYTNPESLTTLTNIYNEKVGAIKELSVSSKECTGITTLAFHVSPGLFSAWQDYFRKRPRGALTLDLLQSPALRIGWMPKRGSNKWKSIKTTTPESLTRLAPIILEEYENMPDLLRKKVGCEEMTTKVVLSNVFDWHLGRGQKETPAEEWASISSFLEELFESGSLNDALQDVSDAESELYDWDHLPAVKDLRREATQQREKELAVKEADAAHKLMSASYEETVACVEGDTARFQAWCSTKDSVRSDQYVRETKHAKRIQDMGESASKGYLDANVQILMHVPRPSAKEDRRNFSLKARPGKYAQLINQALNSMKHASQATGCTLRENKTLVLNIVDHIVTSHIADVHGDDALCVSSQMCTAVGSGVRTATLVVLPTVHSDNNDHQCIKQTRKVEDALLAQKLNLGLRASLKYTDADLHRNTKKPLTNWVILAVSDPSTNVFASSNLAKGKTTDSTLINARDMVVLEEVGADSLPSAVTKNHLMDRTVLSAASRQRQRGAPACLAALLDVFSDIDATKADAILVLEWHTCTSADWTRAVRQIQNDKLMGVEYAAKLPKILGMCFPETEEEQSFLISTFQSELYDQWYNDKMPLPSVGRVGPKELPEDQRIPNPPVPTYKICYHGKTNKGEDCLVIPGSVDLKFTANEAMLAKWKKYKEEQYNKYGRPADVVAKTTIGGQPSAAPRVVPQGPEAMPAVNDSGAYVVPEENIVDSAELVAKTMATSLMHQYKKLLIVVTQEKDGRKCLWIDGAGLDIPQMELPALDTYLLGFGGGEWAFGNTNLDAHLQYKLTSDMDMITYAPEDKSKKTAPVCTILWEISKIGKEGKLAYHNKEVLVNESTGQTLRHRFNISPIKEKQVHFVPAHIDLQARKEAHHGVDASELGAVFANEYQSLPTQLASLIFDLGSYPSSEGPHFLLLRPKQVKLILTTSLKIPKGKAVRLV